ncbi:MAG: ketopantoate reductase family protein [Candidatus Binataceae bacterium]
MAVVGCGAVGGVIAACLTRAGNDVTAIVGNPRIETAIADEGFRLHDLNGDLSRIPPSHRPVRTAQEAGATFDLVIIATPSTALETAIKEVIPFLAPDGRIVTCQNGLPEDRARAVAGDRIIGCVVGWGATMSEPGVYQRTSSGRLQIGKAGAAGPSPDDLVPILAAVSPVEVAADLPAVRWSKLAINCVTSPFGAIGGAPLGTLLMDAKVRRLALEVFAEVAAVAQLEGIKMQPVAGTLNITSVALTDREKQARLFSPSLLFKHLLLLLVGFKFRRMRSSMLYALERGRPIEIDFLNGEITKRGARLGFPTPVNDAIIQTVRQIEQRKKSSSPQSLRDVYSQLHPARL